MQSKKMSSLLLVLSFLTMPFRKAKGANNTSKIQIRHQQPTMVERGTPFELSFDVPGINPNNVQEAYIFYRSNDEIAYSQKKATLVSTDVKAQLEVNDKQATSLAYYLMIELNNGDKVTYPRKNAAGNPVRVEVVEHRQSKRERRVEATGVDYTILSPTPGSTVAQNDVVLALTLFYDPTKVDTAHTSFQMILDNHDVTEKANASDYFYTYSPDKLAPGKHTVVFNLQKSDTVLKVAGWKFTVLNPKGVMTAGSGNNSADWMPQGSVQLTARDQEVGGFPNNALTGNLSLSGRHGNITYSAHGFLTSQEDPRLQTQNRFGARLTVGNWLDLAAGHVYPNLSLLTIAGQRMEGINAGVHLWDDFVNLRFIHGRLRRGIDNIYKDLKPEYQKYQGTPVDTTYALNVDNGGTFKRKITGGRLAIGRDNNFQFGLNFLKVQDDTNSIGIVRGYRSLKTGYPGLMDKLSTTQRKDLAAHPDQLSISGNPKPKGNFVAASDLDLSLDDDRIRLRSNFGASLLNRDISGGVLTQQRAEDFGLTIDPNTQDLLSRLSWLIIINKNVDALPQRFAAGEYGSSAQAFVPNSILATRSQLGLHYFDNNFRFQYRWIGPNYNSLANTTIRKDIAGYTLSDRFRLLEDRIYVTLGYENLQDNVTNSKDATTSNNTYRANISWYPIDPKLPRLSLGGMERTRDNRVDLYNPYLSGVSNNAALQNFMIQKGDTLIAPNPRLSNTYQLNTSISQRFTAFGVTNDASFSYSFSTTKDRMFNFGDTKSNSLSMRVVNRFSDSPLQTNIGLNYNHTKSGSGLTNIKIYGAHIGGSLFLLNDKLNVNASLAFTRNRSETIPLAINKNGTADNSDDYYQANNQAGSQSRSNSYIANVGVRYNLTTHHSFLLNFRYSNIRNTFSSLEIPDDHLLQARYIYNF